MDAAHRRRNTRPLVRAALAVACLALSGTAAAHPPYEHVDRVVADQTGRKLTVFKSYVDGIMFTDPVKLVIRDDDDRTVAETDYGRDVSIFCRRSNRCIAFRYEGAVSVLPQNVWTLEDGRLLETHSGPLVALGILAPLWDHTGGYLFALLALAVPCAALWLARTTRPPRLRAALIAVFGLAAIPYFFVWLYCIVGLSYLSLPLVVVVAALVSAILALAVRSGLKAGMAGPRLRRLARLTAAIVVGLAALAITAGIFSFVWTTRYSRQITFEEPAVKPPLAKARLTRVSGATSEIFATVSDGVKLDSVVNLQLFEGFDAAMTRDQAESRLGPPSGRWTDPAFSVRAVYYARPGGRVSLVRRGAADWTTTAHPSPCTHDLVFPDDRLRVQVLRWVPAHGRVQVNVLRSVGWGGLTVFFEDGQCTHLVLTAREGDP